MIKKPLFFALVGSLLLTTLPHQVRADEEEEEIFVLPDMEFELFDTKKVDFGGRRGVIQKTAMVNALIRIAADLDQKQGVKNTIRSNALAIAGRIDPKSSFFKETLEQLEENAKAFGAQGTKKDRLVTQIYDGVRRLMKEDNEDNQICAAYSIDVALRLDPGHDKEDKLKEFQTELKHVEIDWDDLKGKAVVGIGDMRWGQRRGRMEKRTEKIPAGPAKKLAVNQASVVGLVVVQIDGGKHAGAAREIIATALRDEKVKGVNLTIDQEVGDMMANSLKSIKDYLRVIYEPQDMIPAGYQVNIVFQDRDQPSDGPSAGTAMALMLDALFSGEKIDPKFACTGGLTPNGKCTTIGGVAAKIRGATRRKCTIVGVPAGNANEVKDILVLEGYKPLLDIQVFTMENMDQAKAISRATKADDVQATLDDFNAVAEVIRDQGEKMLRNKSVQKKLQGVIKSMPNHISAKLLLDFATGKPPEALSISGSLHEIDSRASGIMNRTRLMMFRDRFSEGRVARQEAGEVLKELKKIDGKVHEKFENYLKAAIGITEHIEAGVQDGEEDFMNDLKRKFETMSSERNKLLEDPAVREAIMG